MTVPSCSDVSREICYGFLPLGDLVDGSRFVTIKIAMAGKTREFLRHVVPAVLKPIRSLWNELIALVFFVLALPALSNLVVALRQDNPDAGTIFKIILTSLFAAVMLFFAVASFLKARRISRS